VSYLLVAFFFLSFFFCNHAFIVFRYKKPHAALAMEKTKPIKQKQLTKESYGTSQISTIAQVSPPPGQRPNITRKVQTNNLVIWQGKLIYKVKERKPSVPIPLPTKKHQRPGGAPWGERDRTGGRRGGWWVGTLKGEIPWR